VFEKKLAVLMRELTNNSGKISQVFSASDIEENLAGKMMSAIFTIEGPAGFGYDPALLEDLYKIGFRITTLGWNEDSPLAGSHITGGGLTDLGREYVKEAQRLGMLVDVSHISDQGFWDIMDITDSPVIASHSNSRAVWQHSRNITDDMFRAICKTGGVVGINLYPDFLGENADLETVCRHVLHFASLDPECAHIALGGDLDGIERTPAGFDGIQDYPKLAEAMLANGLTEEQVYRIFWQNALGVMKQCCM
jgi:membrane dipeptidase